MTHWILGIKDRLKHFRQSVSWKDCRWNWTRKSESRCCFPFSFVYRVDDVFKKAGTFSDPLISWRAFIHVDEMLCKPQNAIKCTAANTQHTDAYTFCHVSNSRNLSRVVWFCWNGYMICCDRFGNCYQAPFQTFLLVLKECKIVVFVWRDFLVKRVFASFACFAFFDRFHDI